MNRPETPSPLRVSRPAALLSIHARIDGAHPAIWDDDAFVQVWGPRWATYVVPAEDHALEDFHVDAGRVRDDLVGPGLAEQRLGLAQCHGEASQPGRAGRGHAVAGVLDDHDQPRLDPQPGGEHACGHPGDGREPARRSRLSRSASIR